MVWSKRSLQVGNSLGQHTRLIERNLSWKPVPEYNDLNQLAIKSQASCVICERNIESKIRRDCLNLLWFVDAVGHPYRDSRSPHISQSLSMCVCQDFANITSLKPYRAYYYNNASCFMKNFLVSRHLWLVHPGHLRPNCLLPTSPLLRWSLASSARP